MSTSRRIHMGKDAKRRQKSANIKESKEKEKIAAAKLLQILKSGAARIKKSIKSITIITIVSIGATGNIIRSMITTPLLGMMMLI
jgi:hypothetical protein